ncbi:Uncharacterised protein [Vibrio cholerae]|nr:Uncharacterised protein [Vibrio cholerae]
MAYFCLDCARKFTVTTDLSRSINACYPAYRLHVSVHHPKLIGQAFSRRAHHQPCPSRDRNCLCRRFG